MLVAWRLLTDWSESWRSNSNGRLISPKLSRVSDPAGGSCGSPNDPVRPSVHEWSGCNSVWAEAPSGARAGSDDSRDSSPNGVGGSCARLDGSVMRHFQ